MRGFSGTRAESRALRCSGILMLGFALAVLPQVAQAQPFTAWLTMVGNPTNGFVEIPANAALNPTGAFTFEAWVAISNNVAGEDCRSIAGKNSSPF